MPELPPSLRFGKEYLDSLLRKFRSPAQDTVSSSSPGKLRKLSPLTASLDRATRYKPSKRKEEKKIPDRQMSDCKLEHTLVELNEMRWKFYAEPEMRSTQSNIRPVSTSQAVDEKLKEKLIAAERVMQQLYRRNKALEEAAGSKADEWLKKENSLLEEIARLQEQNHQLELKLQEMNEEEASKKDTYVNFLEEHVKETLADSKRHLANYMTVRNNLNSTLKSKTKIDTNMQIKFLRQQLDHEIKSRAEEQEQYEARLAKVRFIHSGRILTVNIS